MKETAGQEQKRYRACLQESPRLFRPAEALDWEADIVGRVSRYVLAPVLGVFAEWVLGQARRDGRRRLYFLARDGYLPYQAVRLLCQKRGLPLECRYLCCSRYSLRVPLFHRLPREETLNYVCRSGVDVTLPKILVRAGLDRREADAVRESLPLSGSGEERLSYAELGEIRRLLADCPLFWEYTDRHSRLAWPGLAGYLRQEGLLEEQPDALVDSGWVGSMQKTLGGALELLGRTRPLRGYYWGLYELPDGVRRGDYRSCFFTPEGELREKVFFCNSLFEAIFTAPHGMTLSYRQEGGRFVPCYAPMAESRTAFVRRLEGLLLPYIARFAEEQAPDEAQQRAELRTVGKLLARFMGSPSREEAEAFGSLPFSDDVLEEAGRQIASPLTETELTAGHALGRIRAAAGIKKGGVRDSAWYEGSAVRFSSGPRRHLRQYRLYQYLRHLRKIRGNRKKGRE